VHLGEFVPIPIEVDISMEYNAFEKGVGNQGLIGFVTELPVSDGALISIETCLEKQIKALVIIKADD
jgi:hypothetical protein